MNVWGTFWIPEKLYFSFGRILDTCPPLAEQNNIDASVGASGRVNRSVMSLEEMTVVAEKFRQTAREREIGRSMQQFAEDVVDRPKTIFPSM